MREDYVEYGRRLKKMIGKIKAELKSTGKTSGAARSKLRLVVAASLRRRNSAKLNRVSAVQPCARTWPCEALSYTGPVSL
jgi:hypothetical protein